REPRARRETLRPCLDRRARDHDRACTRLAGVGRSHRQPDCDPRGFAMNAIELEILWSNLISTVSEQAKALQRIAFSAIVREAGDLATALFDAKGRLIAQAVTGTPGHINSLAA